MFHWTQLVLVISRLVLVVLLALSIWSISIMVERRRLLNSVRAALGHGTRLEELQRAIRKDPARPNVTLKGEADLLGQVLTTAIDSSPNGRVAVEHAVQSLLALERGKLDRGLTTLATLGSNTPFIGLFGTVLGIIQAFGELAGQSANNQSVVGGISEALVATALGLLVAIPAVIAYNFFSLKTREIISQAHALKDYYLAYAALRSSAE